ncbi:MAG TPA: hypothetical protein VKA30_05855 [Actinomycetota bacterium]|nr:hypothetical protein [Actinomycetota bacterium]
MAAKDGRTRGKAFRWFERTVLSAGMSAVAFIVERRLLKAIKTGGVKPAPRTAAEGEALGESFGVDPVAGLTTAPEEVPEEP